MLSVRPGKEVEAAVKAEYGVGLLHHRPYRGKAYHVVIAGAAGELPQVLGAEARLGGVYDSEAPRPCSLACSTVYMLLGAGKAGRRLYRSRPAGRGGGRSAARSLLRRGPWRPTEASIAILPPSTMPILMLIAAGRGVVHGVEGADDAAHGLCEGAVEVCVGIVGQQAVGQQRSRWGCWRTGLSPPQYGIGVAGGHLGALVVMRGLYGEALAGLVLVLPVFAHLGLSRRRTRVPLSWGFLRRCPVRAYGCSPSTAAL